MSHNTIQNCSLLQREAELPEVLVKTTESGGSSLHGGGVQGTSF